MSNVVGRRMALTNIEAAELAAQIQKKAGAVTELLETGLDAARAQKSIPTQEANARINDVATKEAQEAPSLKR